MLKPSAGRVRITLTDIVHVIPTDHAHLSVQWLMVLQKHGLLLLMADRSNFAASIRIHLINVRHSRLRVTRTYSCILKSRDPLRKLPWNLIDDVALALGIVR